MRTSGEIRMGTRRRLRVVPVVVAVAVVLGSAGAAAVWNRVAADRATAAATRLVQGFEQPDRTTVLRQEIADAMAYRAKLARAEARGTAVLGTEVRATRPSDPAVIRTMRYFPVLTASEVQRMHFSR